MIVIKQQVLDNHPKAAQQINFTTNLNRAGKALMCSIYEEIKEIILDYSQGFVNVV